MRRVLRRNCRPVVLPVVGALALLASACGGDDAVSDATPPAAVTTGQPTASPTTPDGSGPSDAQRFPDVVAVEVTAAGGGTYDFAVTISSPYDTPERYADGWRIVGPNGTVFGQHTLMHDHAAEQPFTRTQRGVEIPAGVIEVTVEGRDLVNGFGGETEPVQLPDR